MEQCQCGPECEASTNETCSRCGLKYERRNLRQRWPSGMKIADDEADSKREWLKSQIETLKKESQNDAL